MQRTRGCTYQSPLDSVRAEPALLPAAAEAKEAGAIVVVESCGRSDGGVEALRFVMVECGKLIGGSCERSKVMSSCKLTRAERARGVALESSSTGERER